MPISYLTNIVLLVLTVNLMFEEQIRRAWWNNSSVRKGWITVEYSLPIIIAPLIHSFQLLRHRDAPSGCENNTDGQHYNCGTLNDTADANFRQNAHVFLSDWSGEVITLIRPLGNDFCTVRSNATRQWHIWQLSYVHLAPNSNLLCGVQLWYRRRWK